MLGKMSFSSSPMDASELKIYSTSAVGMQYAIIQEYKNNPLQNYICAFTEYFRHADKICKALNQDKAEYANISYKVVVLRIPD